MPLLRHRWTPAAGVGIAAAVAVGAWALWPTVRGPDRRTDVLVAASGDVAASTVPLERRIREAGFTVEIQPAADWCAAVAALPAQVTSVRPRYVVVGIADLGSCAGQPVADALAGLPGVSIVLVAEPGTASAAVRTAATERGITLADPARLLGDARPSTQPCLWWDAACPGGSIEVRDARGELTPAGAERLARVVAAELV